MRKIMPPLNRTMSLWTWFLIFAAAVSLGLVAGASSTLAQQAPSPGEMVVYRLREVPTEHGGQWASVPPVANGHDQAGVGRARSDERSLVPGRSTSFLTEAQISMIKSRLKLMPHQERYWPAVAAALRRIACRKTREGATILDSDSVQRLYAAAGELVGSLNAAQLGEVQRLARLVGLEN
jgi:hypothetical protein